MLNMGLEEEWLASILKKTTKLHHQKSLEYFKEYMKKEPKEILELRRTEGRRFSTRVVLFWKWMQETKKLSANTSSSYCIGVSAFFSYMDLPLKLKGKIPDTKMKIERYQPTLEDLQKSYRLGDLQTKALLSLMRDCPARIGDLIKQVIPRVKEKKFLIESKKEGVVGKVYVSEETLTLFKQLEEASLSLPRTKRGIGKLLEKACKISNIPKLNPHLMRKYFFTVATNLNLNRDIIRVLMFQSVAKETLTYWLNREELRDFWRQIINKIPLEAKMNKSAINAKELAQVALEGLGELLEPIIQKKLLELQMQKAGGQTLGIIQKPDLSKLSAKEKVELFLKLRKEEKEEI